MGGALNIHPKVVGGGLGGALTLILIWGLGLAHVNVDPVVAGAMVVVISAFCGWLSPILKVELPSPPVMPPPPPAIPPRAA